jgi:hypothetical protein
MRATALARTFHVVTVFAGLQEKLRELLVEHSSIPARSPWHFRKSHSALGNPGRSRENWELRSLDRSDLH